jgi:hypothetical protein
MRGAPIRLQLRVLAIWCPIATVVVSGVTGSVLCAVKVARSVNRASRHNAPRDRSRESRAGRP